MAISKVGVVGAGTMGSGIIEVASRNGLDVVAREVSPELVEAGKARVEGSMSKAVERESSRNQPATRRWPTPRGPRISMRWLGATLWSRP